MGQEDARVCNVATKRILSFAVEYLPSKVNYANSCRIFSFVSEFFGGKYGAIFLAWK